LAAAQEKIDMNSKYFFASVAAASVLALTSPAHAGLLGGGLSGAAGGTLSGGLNGIGGIGGIGGMTSTATSSVRDVNSIGRATTQHAHDTVSATADATDRAAANVDKQLESTKAAANATADAASSATSSVDTDAAKSKLGETKAPAAKEPAKPVKTEPVKAPGVDASVGASSSANGGASVQR
jgi:hypothetical protein